MALGLISYPARCARGKGSYAEAVVGVLFFAGTIISCSLSFVAFVLGGESAPPRTLFLLDAANGIFLLFAGFCVWRCAFNVKYWLVGFITRLFVILYVLVYGTYLWNSFSNLPSHQSQYGLALADHERYVE